MGPVALRPRVTRPSMCDSLSSYDYSFPRELIAQHPLPRRDGSRLLVLDRQSGKIESRPFTDIVRFFCRGDVLVLNDSKVFPCRLVTERAGGGRQEIFLIRQKHGNIWEAIVNAGHKIKMGEHFDFEDMRVTVLTENGFGRDVRLEHNERDIFTVLQRVGHIPLPPYIRRADTAKDRERYQTVFAKTVGSVAAPTAGLHFTSEILQRLKDRGVEIAFLTLHVGPGTFLPIRVPDIADHKMHTEEFVIDDVACRVIVRARQEGRRITAVGTTTTRALESLDQVLTCQDKAPQHARTDLFIRPPFTFKVVNRLITNFHQPRSTLLMLVSVFAGRDKVLNAYTQAIQQRYRLFSYGDAMLIQ